MKQVHMVNKILIGIFVLLVVFHVCSGLNGTHMHWMLVHYHKTGHDLARRLADAFQDLSCKTKISYKFDRRTDIKNNLVRILSTDIAVVAAPDIRYPWNASVFGSDVDNVRIVHFVRDPVDMILSAYLYHAQNPYPSGEVWLVNKSFNPCQSDQFVLEDVYGSYIGAYFEDVHRVQQLILSCKAMCDVIFKMRNVTTHKGYNELLQKLPPQEGVLLEAARSLVSKSGGDILRMATNAIFESRTANRQSRRVFLGDFPVDKVDRFTASTRNVFEFLMIPVAEAKTPFWTCVNLTTATERAVRNALVNVNSPPNVTKNLTPMTTHITQNRIRTEERQELKNYLESHKVLGPLLAIINSILRS